MKDRILQMINGKLPYSQKEVNEYLDSLTVEELEKFNEEIESTMNAMESELLQNQHLLSPEQRKRLGELMMSRVELKEMFPNEETIRAMFEAGNGINMTSCESIEDLFKRLKLDSKKYGEDNA